MIGLLLEFGIALFTGSFIKKLTQGDVALWTSTNSKNMLWKSPVTVCPYPLKAQGQWMRVRGEMNSAAMIMTNCPYGSPKRRNRILHDFNRANIDDVDPMGGDQGMAVLKDMNDLEAGHDAFVMILPPTFNVL